MQPGMLVADKYRLVQRIGEGGMGSVWRARHEVTERVVAVKFLSSLHAESPALLRRFLREARMAGRMRHPGLIEVFDAGVLDDTASGPYLVMELLDGVPLDQAIRRTGGFSVGLALEILHGIASAMVEVHDKGIVHRDLKPANVFMHRPGTGAIVTKILDFGVSKVRAQDTKVGPLSLTTSGVVIGSPRYMSPEQAAGDTTIDERSDIHAMGVLLWECITGEPLFGSVEPTSLAAQILAGTRPRLDVIRPGVQPFVADLVAASTAIERDQRPPTAKSFTRAIERAFKLMGHQPALVAPHGAERFMALLGPELPGVTEGTSLLSEPDANEPAPSPEAAALRSDPCDVDQLAIHRKGEPGIVLAPPPTPDSTPPLEASGRTAPEPTLRATLRLALVVTVLLVGAVAGIVSARALSPPSAAHSTTYVSSVTVVALASAATDTPVATTSSSAMAPPVGSVSSAPPPTGKPEAAKPVPRSTKPAAPRPLHHGIIESGL